MTGENVTEQADARLNAMVATQNGFELAELDLQQRGPGEFFGTRQTGLPEFRVANLLRDRATLELAKVEAERFAARPDPELSSTERTPSGPASNSSGSAATAWSRPSRADTPRSRHRSCAPARLRECEFPCPAPWSCHTRSTPQSNADAPSWQPRLRRFDKDFLAVEIGQKFLESRVRGNSLQFLPRYGLQQNPRIVGQFPELRIELRP